MSSEVFVTLIERQFGENHGYIMRSSSSASKYGSLLVSSKPISSAELIDNYITFTLRRKSLTFCLSKINLLKYMSD